MRASDVQRRVYDSWVLSFRYQKSRVAKILVSMEGVGLLILKGCKYPAEMQIAKSMETEV